MSSNPEPGHRSQLQLGAAATVAAVVVIVAAGWALRPVTVPAPPQAVPVSAVEDGASIGSGADAAAWQVELWQPLRDPPPPTVEAPPPPPMSAQLLAIAEREGQAVAVLEVESGGKLHYLPAGGRAGRYTVLRIEDGAVVLDHAGREARLELPR